MNNKDDIIRLERKSEYKEVENLTRETFWNVYRPGCLEHYVLNQLRNDPHLSLNWISSWRRMVNCLA